MKGPLLLVGLAGLHHDQRWRRLCADLGVRLEFHAMSGPVSALSGLVDAEDENAHRLADEARRALTDRIEALKPFAVHALGSHPAGFLAQDALARANHRAPLLVHIRGGAELELYRHSPPHDARFLSLFPAASAVIADNALSYQSARDYGFSDALKLHFATCLPGNCGELTLTSPESGPQGRSPVVLWPKASASPNVDPYPIIEAVARLWRQGRRFQLVAFGLDWPELRMFAQRRFAGLPLADFAARPSVPREAFLTALQGADVLLSPSMFDGISNVLLEAMAAGVAPVVSPHPALPAELLGGDTINFADNLDVSAIETALAAVFDLSAADRASRATRNAAWAAAHCDRRRILTDVADLYSRMAAAFAARPEDTA